jgi:type IV pilus assembly protein PilX
MSARPGWLGRPARRVHQRGVTLVVVLVLLIASVFLGVSAAVIALQTEKASRGDRDRQIAFQAAEAALIDAQRDIETAGTAAPSHRALVMAPDSALGFPPADQAQLCNPSSDPVGFGLCRRPAPNVATSWPAVDLSDPAISVPYGQFTGQQFTNGQTGLAARPPRYVIELMPYVQSGQNATTQSFAYRISAIGFGTSADTQVVLQAIYRKEN